MSERTHALLALDVARTIPDRIAIEGLLQQVTAHEIAPHDID